jgi:hypothetical protein
MQVKVECEGYFLPHIKSQQIATRYKTLQISSVIQNRHFKIKKYDLRQVVNKGRSFEQAGVRGERRA